MKAKRRDTRPAFGPRGSVRYDARTYRLMSLDRVSLNTQEGRAFHRLVLDPRRHAMLVDPAWEVGGADLVWRAGTYYLHISQSREAPAETEPDGGTLGIDLSITNLAAYGEGEHVIRKIVHLVRNRYHLRRQRLQKFDTKNARRRIPCMGQCKAHFQRDTNHAISKKLVQKAAADRKAVALVDLSGMRGQTTIRRAHRFQRHSWAFFQLRQYITY